MRSRWLWAGGVLVLFAGVYQSQRAAAPAAGREAVAELPTAPVSTASAERRDLPVFLKASGRAEARASVTVKSRVDGQVAAILFKEGAPVRNGQILLRMDPATAGVTRSLGAVSLPTTMHGSFQGNAKAFEASVSTQPWRILAAVLAVYIVLGILYESYIHPLTILSTLPPAGSAAYAMAGTFKWKNSLESRPTVAIEFYAVIVAATIGGVVIGIAPIDPIKALFWSAVINGVISVPARAVMMLVAGRKGG